jgi:hypothetical protein
LNVRGGGSPKRRTAGSVASVFFVFFRTVVVCVQLAHFHRMMRSVRAMSGRRVRMMRCRLGIVFFILLRSFAMMAGGVFVMLRGGVMVLADGMLVRHEATPDLVTGSHSGAGFVTASSTTFATKFSPHDGVEQSTCGVHETAAERSRQCPLHGGDFICVTQLSRWDS